MNVVLIDDQQTHVCQVITMLTTLTCQKAGKLDGRVDRRSSRHGLSLLLLSLSLKWYLLDFGDIVSASLGAANC